MKIATYNIWNENDGVGSRFHALISEIITVNADIIALQEVAVSFYQKAKEHLPLYPYSEFRTYWEESEGLAFFSKYPLESCTFLHTEKAYKNSNALNVILQTEKARYSFTNVHLPWDSVKAREQQILSIDQYIHSHQNQADHFLLLGDFNSDISSSVHRFLTCEQTLCSSESIPGWLDVGGTFSALNNIPLAPTLDFIGNPRWKGQHPIYTPKNFDRIYIMDTWKSFYFENVQLFGTKTDPASGLCPSDHYGLAATIQFDN